MTGQLVYKDFAKQVPTVKLDLVLDSMSEKEDEHLSQLAELMARWREDYVPAMDFKIRDIRWVEEHYDHEKEQRVGFLRLWKKRCEREATYGRILKACVHTNNKECAQLIIDLLMDLDVPEPEEPDNLERLFYMDKEAPSFSDLSFIRSKKGGKTFRLMQQVATHWDKIGNTLGIDTAELDMIRADNDRDVLRRVEKVFGIWIANASGLPRKKFYPYSWSGLREILIDSDLSRVADEYFRILESL